LHISLHEEFQTTSFNNNEKKPVNAPFEGFTKKARLSHTCLHKRYASKIEQTPD